MVVRDLYGNGRSCDVFGSLVETEQTKNLNLLHTKRYALFWVSSLFSNIGTWMQQVAQPWLILSISHSSFWVGLDSFFMNAPSWIFTLWGGYLADRFDRKKIVLVCQSFQFFWIVLLFTLIVLGKIKIWIILVSSLLIGISDSLSMPAFQSIIPSLVSKDEVSEAVALNSIQFNLSRVLGPVLAGIVIAGYGVSVCYGANLISFIPFFLSLYFIYPRGGFKKIHETNSDQSTPLLKQFKNILLVRTYQAPLLTVFVSSMFCSPLLTFCPVIVKNVFHGNAHDLGWSMTAFGAGGVVGGIIISVLNKKITGSKYFSNIVAIFLGAIIVLVTMSPSLLILDLFLLIAGAALIVTNITSNSNLQKSAGDQIRGRVVSLFQMALHSGISLGSLLTGSASSKFGIIPVLIFNGILAALFQLTILNFAHRNYEY